MKFKQKIIDALVKKTVNDEKYVHEMKSELFEHKRRISLMEQELLMYKSQS